MNYPTTLSGTTYVNFPETDDLNNQCLFIKIFNLYIYIYINIIIFNNILIQCFVYNIIFIYLFIHKPQNILFLIDLV